MFYLTSATAGQIWTAITALAAVGYLGARRQDLLSPFQEGQNQSNQANEVLRLTQQTVRFLETLVPLTVPQATFLHDNVSLQRLRDRLNEGRAVIVSCRQQAGKRVSTD